MSSNEASLHYLQNVLGKISFLRFSSTILAAWEKKDFDPHCPLCRVMQLA